MTSDSYRDDSTDHNYQSLAIIFMSNMHPHIKKLLQCIELEEKEQQRQFSIDSQHPLKKLKAEGLALHPISVVRKNFGYADYPEVSFRLSYPAEINLFRNGLAIECFYAGEEPVKGVLVNMEGKSGEFRLFAPDHPDWIDEPGVGIKLAPDQRTTTIMKTALRQLPEHKAVYELFGTIHGGSEKKYPLTSAISAVITSATPHLNNSQQAAVQAIVHNDAFVIVHGPPGTGKTTTLVEAIVHLVKHEQRVLVAAPSNTAVDHITKSLIASGVRTLRVGNAGKADQEIYSHTPEGILSKSASKKELKALRIRAGQFRKMALKYKRRFGKAEREQRSLLFKEVKSIREEIKQIQRYDEEKLYENCQVITGTPIAIYDAGIAHLNFKSLVLDEAGQCIEPLAWCIFPLAKNYVLAGDHLQLPPTVLSNEAARLGFSRSILEAFIEKMPQVMLLDTQYRMREAIAGFSGNYFYKGLLRSAAHLADKGIHINFIDTAGSGSFEKEGANGISLQNKAELDLAKKLMENGEIEPAAAAFISPYSGQVVAAKEVLPPQTRVSTIDSFQGQEKEIVMLSLVRSNEDGNIGFLKDYRRMNVAITRAKEQLYVIGDSATIGADPFYNAFLRYIEEKGSYKTIWEFEL